MALFRVFFGLLICLECWGAIGTGWVKRAFVEVDFTFNFIGFDALQFLVGPQMYVWYLFMGFFGLLVAFGLFYRFSLGAFTIMWWITYLMQKSHYNNHYYLLLILCCLMLLIPADRYLSLGVKLNRVKVRLSLPYWCYGILIFQLWIVFTYASIAKMQADWINGLPIEIWFRSKRNFWLIGSWLQLPSLQKAVVWGGILFDLLIIPLLYFRKTRWLALFIAVVFHLFNSAVFHIGIFPYLMIACSLLFFAKKSEQSEKKYSLGYFKYLLLPFFIIQLALPLRHHLFQSNVNWSDEGHRMAWRMMLRSKSGSIKYLITNLETGDVETIRPRKNLSRSQAGSLASKPDMIWQYAQRLKKQKAELGIKEIEIKVDAKVSLNGRKRQRFIDPEVDFSNLKWERFKSKQWILPFNTEENE